MSQELDDLRQAIAEEDTVIGGAVTLLNGILDRLDQAGTDPVALQELAADVRSQTQALAAAVAAVPPRPSANSTAEKTPV